MEIKLNGFIQVIFSLIFLISFSQVGFAEKYVTDNINCDGFKRVLVGTMNGTCLGLVAQASQGYGFIKPRKIIQIPNTKKFLITDMGGWKPNKGILWLLKTDSQIPVLIPLLKHLNVPHGLAMDKSGQFYVGEKHQIIRFSLENDEKIKDLVPVVKHLPAWRKHRHPLTEFILDHDNNLIVNTAAPSDQCKKNANSQKSCNEFKLNNTDNASLRKYIYDKENDRWDKEYRVLASGLRNSMALTQHQSGTILQAENSIDLSGLNTPFEEINIIKTGQFYGWPYCYDKNTINRFWRTSAKKYCLSSSKYQAPWVHIAPHSAPLDMMYYNAHMLPKLTGKLILSWHGYRTTGHRIIAYNVDSSGRPIRTNNATYSIYQSDKNAPSIKRKFPEHLPSSHATEVVHAWNPVVGYRPKGRPVGMTVANDGSIWMIDDTNKAVLRLSKGKSYIKAFNKKVLARGIKVDDKVVANLFKQHCSLCHTQIIKTSLISSDIYLPHNWLELTEEKKYRIEMRLFDSILPQMPPDKILSSTDLFIFKEWIEQYKSAN